MGRVKRSLTGIKLQPKLKLLLIFIQLPILQTTAHNTKFSTHVSDINGSNKGVIKNLHTLIRPYEQKHLWLHIVGSSQLWSGSRQHRFLPAINQYREKWQKINHKKNLTPKNSYILNYTHWRSCSSLVTFVEKTIGKERSPNVKTGCPLTSIICPPATARGVVSNVNVDVNASCARNSIS
jgi:hypothetical protein